jgi:hypothetical protein
MQRFCFNGGTGQNKTARRDVSFFSDMSAASLRRRSVLLGPRD